MNFVINFPHFFLIFLLHTLILKTLIIKKATGDIVLVSHLRGSKELREKALLNIYKDSRNLIFGLVLKNGGTIDEAKDILQESVIAFYENVRDEKYRGESKLSTYIYSIAKFKWLNALKKKKVRATHYEKHEFEEFSESPLVELLKDEQKNKVMELLEKLGITCKQLLVENLYHHKSMKEICEDNGYSSEQVVRNKKYKCLQKLKELLKKTPHLIQILKPNE